MVQWLGLGTSTAVGTGSIPGRGTKILHATWQGPPPKKKKKKKEREREIIRGYHGERRV